MGYFINGIEIKNGHIYNGQIYDITKNGIFVELDNGVRGLVQIFNIDDINKYYAGDDVQVEVIAYKKREFSAYVYLKFKNGS